MSNQNSPGHTSSRSLTIHDSNPGGRNITVCVHGDNPIPSVEPAVCINSTTPIGSAPIPGNNTNSTGSAPIAIPENNPTHPRWLLDTANWRVCQYTDVQEVVQREGYGIISYTWGMWAKWNKEPNSPPEGLQWKLPVIEEDENDSNNPNYFLNKARYAVSKMGIQHVWWDWMCVPQGNGLPEELMRVKGEEVSKQMAIYSGARKSIVWLHSTNWGEGSTVEELLIDQVTRDSIEELVDDVDQLLSDLRHNEPWLTSGWTLQEGVLLSETVLLDHDGHTLPHPQFLHNDGKASVLDLTVGLTTLAIHIASAFMKITEAHSGGDYDQVAQYINTSDDNYQEIACFLSRLLRSGFIAYTKRSPLFILAGKHSRRFGVEHDKCWALLGALGLGNITPPPDYNLEMDKVKAIFFGHLLREHQWNLLLVAGHSRDHERLSPHHWHTRFADGVYLPLGVYFDVHWKPNLPYLSWLGTTTKEKDALHMQSTDGQKFIVLKLHNESAALGRQYEQLTDPDGFPYIQVHPIQKLPPSSRMYFPIADLEGTVNKPGMRCIQIEPTSHHVDVPATEEPRTGARATGGPGTGGLGIANTKTVEVKSKLQGYFCGVIDIWAAEWELETDHQFHKFTLFSPL